MGAAVVAAAVAWVAGILLDLAATLCTLWMGTTNQNVNRSPTWSTLANDCQSSKQTVVSRGSWTRTLHARRVAQFGSPWLNNLFDAECQLPSRSWTRSWSWVYICIRNARSADNTTLLVFLFSFNVLDRHVSYLFQSTTEIFGGRW